MTSIISGERSISYPEIHARIARAATGFRALGLGGGTPVAMMLRNDFAFFEVSGAAAALGSPVVPINWHLKAEEVAYILADSGAKILVCHADLLPQISGRPARRYQTAGGDDAAGNRRRVQRRARADAGPRRHDRLGHLARHACAIAGAADRQRADVLYVGHHGPAQGRAPQADAAGTGSRPRRGSAAIAYGVKPNEDQVILMNGPMYHSAPNSYGMLAFRSGCTIVLEPRFDPEDMLQLIERHRVTHMHMVPTMFVRLLRLPDEVKQPIRSVVAALHRARRGALPAAGQARHDRVVGAGHPRIFRLDRDRHSGVALGRGGAGKARHRRPRHRRRHRQDLPPRRRRCATSTSPAKSSCGRCRCRISTITARPRRAPRPAATASSASATSATSTRTAICSCATASATW